jgi:alkanesulfonate monooxygenase SsuD/methylene tetrahydromethanopterin reductase-like flavin-dependent oxidoreductase (luciferase family)
VDLGVHLPLLAFDGEAVSAERVRDVAETARECGFAALAANDHLVFQRPWLDGPTALASVIERSGAMTLATTASLAVVRGPVAVAKALAAVDLLSDGRLIAAIGAGHGRPGERRADAPRRAGTDAGPHARRAARNDLHRLTRALRRAALPVRASRVPARPSVAAR